MITEEVHAMRDALGFPGMRVLSSLIRLGHRSYHRPESYPPNSIAYTGTHDNDTVVGWFQQRRLNSMHSGKRDLLDRYLSADTREDSIHWQLMAMVFNSASHTAIVPMQDVLGLGNSARMNLPGMAQGIGNGRLLPEQLEDSLAAQQSAYGTFPTFTAHQLGPLYSLAHFAMGQAAINMGFQRYLRLISEQTRIPIASAHRTSTYRRG